MAKYCSYCGESIEPKSAFCPNCGAKLKEETTSNPSKHQEETNSTPGAYVYPEAKSRMAAGLLGIFCGGIGLHNFYLGFNSRGVTQILVTFFTCGIGAFWGFIEGIMIRKIN